MRISDWSSDVCSSDLHSRIGHRLPVPGILPAISVDCREDTRQLLAFVGIDVGAPDFEPQEGAVASPAVPRLMLETVVENQQLALTTIYNGKNAVWESMCPHVLVSVVAGTLKKQ